MHPRSLRLFTFHSLCGGAGRTTLALRAAVRLAQDNPDARVWFVEGNLLGTTVTDALECAPASYPLLATRQDGSATSFVYGAKPAPFYLNHFLLFAAPDWTGLEPSVEAGRWRIAGAPENLRLLPASPDLTDQERLVAPICDEHVCGFLEGRFEALLDTLLGESEGAPLYVLIEAPRDLTGLGRALLSLALRLGAEPKIPLARDGLFPEHLRAADVQARAVLVVSPHLGDLHAAPCWLALRRPEERALLVPLLNRVPPAWAPAELHELLRGAPRIEEGVVGLEVAVDDVRQGARP